MDPAIHISKLGLINILILATHSSRLTMLACRVLKQNKFMLFLLVVKHRQHLRIQPVVNEDDH